MSQQPQQERAQPPAPSQSQTTTQTQTHTRADTQAPRILRLRGADNPSRSVQWAENVVDNEGMGRKSSKVCCIYHRPKAVDESSEESSSSSDSGSDGEKRREKKCGHGHGRRKDGKERRPSPNAYERVPKKPAEKKKNDAV